MPSKLTNKQVKTAADLACETVYAYSPEYCESLKGFAWVRYENDIAMVYTPDASPVCYIAIRGTDDPADWEDNLKLRRVVANNRDTLSGFATPARALSSKLHEKVAALRVSGATVVFCGHSRGGALALLLAHQFRAHCVTFGAPMVWAGRGPSTWHTTGDFFAPPLADILSFEHVRDPVCDVHRLTGQAPNPGRVTIGRWWNPDHVSWLTLLFAPWRAVFSYIKRGHNRDDYRRNAYEWANNNRRDMEAN